MIEERRAVHFTAHPVPKPRLQVSSVGGLRCLLDHFRINGDVDIVTDYNATVVQGGVPLHAEVLSIDFGESAGSGALIAPGILDGSGGPIHIEHDFLAGAANGEIAGDFELAGSNLFNLFGLESHGGEVRDVEKFVAPKVVVAAGLAGVHGGDVNGDVDGGFGDVLVVEHDRAVDLAERAADGGNGHVTDRKLRGGMLRIDLPLGSGRDGRKRKNGCESGGYCNSRWIVAHVF